jgi:hypothetical protein
MDNGNVSLAAPTMMIHIVKGTGNSSLQKKNGEDEKKNELEKKSVKTRRRI